MRSVNSKFSYYPAIWSEAEDLQNHEQIESAVYNL